VSDCATLATALGETKSPAHCSALNATVPTANFTTDNGADDSTYSPTDIRSYFTAHLQAKQSAEWKAHQSIELCSHCPA
jgi:hypothetical protein